MFAASLTATNSAPERTHAANRGLLSSVGFSTILVVHAMSGLQLIATATFLLILHWAYFYWLISRIELYGHSVAWGVVRGIRISREERRRRLWSLWWSHLCALWIMPLMVGFAFWEMSELAVEPGPRRLVRLYAVVDLSMGVGVLLMAALWMSNLAKRVRSGKFGFVGEGKDPYGGRSTGE